MSLELNSTVKQFVTNNFQVETYLIYRLARSSPSDRGAVGWRMVCIQGFAVTQKNMFSYSLLLITHKSVFHFTSSYAIYLDIFVSERLTESDAIQVVKCANCCILCDCSGHIYKSDYRTWKSIMRINYIGTINHSFITGDVISDTFSKVRNWNDVIGMDITKRDSVSL